MLEALVSLRTFGTELDDDNCPITDDLSFIWEVSYMAPHLEHFNSGSHCYKRVGGEWVICDSTGPFCSDSTGECAARIFFDIATLCGFG